MGGELRIARDLAEGTAKKLLCEFGSAFRPEEIKDAYLLIREHVEAAIMGAYVQRAREQQRLAPESRN